MIPGQNNLKVAMSVLGTQQIMLHSYLGSETNNIGYDINKYAEPFSLRAIVQPTARNLYEQHGLNFEKHHITVWAEYDIKDISRGSGGDLIEWKGKKYQALSQSGAWSEIDGWSSVICVELD